MGSHSDDMDDEERLELKELPLSPSSHHFALHKYQGARIERQAIGDGSNQHLVSTHDNVSIYNSRFRVALNDMIGTVSMDDQITSTLPLSAEALDSILMEDDAESQGMMEFRLFSGTNQTTSRTANWVRLETPSSQDRTPGFVRPFRPLNHYLRGPLSKAKEEQFQNAAITLHVLSRLAAMKWPGCVYQHRLRVVAPMRGSKASPIHRSVVAVVKPTTQEQTHSRLRKKLGKKARIATRKANKIFEFHQPPPKPKSVIAREPEVITEEERQKRQARNRNKKSKKKARMKAKKLEVSNADPDSE